MSDSGGFFKAEEVGKKLILKSQNDEKHRSSCQDFLTVNQTGGRKINIHILVKPLYQWCRNRTYGV
jgi:hypothetical protein